MHTIEGGGAPTSQNKTYFGEIFYGNQVTLENSESFGDSRPIIGALFGHLDHNWLFRLNDLNFFKRLLSRVTNHSVLRSCHLVVVIYLFCQKVLE